MANPQVLSMGVGLVLQNPIIAVGRIVIPFLVPLSLPASNLTRFHAEQVQADCKDEDQIPQKTALVRELRCVPMGGSKLIPSFPGLIRAAR